MTIDRSARARAVRCHTLPQRMSRTARLELEQGRLEYPANDHGRPSTRSACVGVSRPCPYVSCRYHIYLDVDPRTGALKLNFPDLEVWEMGESCTLDVTDRGCRTLEEVAPIMNLTRERIRQVEVLAMAKLEGSAQLSELSDGGPLGRRVLLEAAE